MTAAVAGVAVRQWRDSSRLGTHEVNYRKVTSSGDVIMSAISPDGRTVAYLAGTLGGENRVVLREVEGGESSPIWTGRDVLGLTWLSDGAHLVVIGTHDSHGAWVVPVLGGPARRVTTYGKFVASSPDATAIALSDDSLVGFHIVSLTTGEARTVKMTGFLRVLAIDWHARTNRIVLSTVERENEVYSVWSVGPDGQEPSRLHTGNEYLRAMCTSPVSDVAYVMVQRRGAMDLLRVPVAPEPGAARVLVTGLTTTRMGYRCSVSRDGRQLLYSRRVGQTNLWRLDFSRPPTQAVALTQGTRDLWFPAVSPDGQWVVATAGSEFEPELVKLPLKGGEPASLGEGAGAVWSPDGQRLAFTSRRTGSLRVWISGADGQRPQEVKDSPVGGPRPLWLPDGRLAWRTPDGQNYRIRDLLTGGDGYLLRANGTGPARPAVSAATASARGQVVLLRHQSPQIVVLVSLPDHAARWLASSMWPIGWSTDGGWIYVLDFGSRTFARLSAETSAIEPIGQFPEGRRIHTCDLTPDPGSIICSLSDETFDAWIMSDFDPNVP